MKKVFFLLTCAATLIATNAQAQFLNRLIHSANNAAKDAVERNVDRKVEEGIDNAFEGNHEEDDQDKSSKSGKKAQSTSGWTCEKCGQEGNQGKFCNNCGAAKPAPKAESANGWTCPACGHSGNQGKFCNECGAKRPDGSAAATWTCKKCGHAGNAGNFCDECGTKKGAVESNTMAWNNYDFVAGDEIIFEDNNANEPLGEFPQMWDALNGAAEIVQINGVKCINLQDADITPLYKDGKTYLTDVFTIEFDAYFRHEKVWEREMGEELHGWGDIYVDLIDEDKISKDWDWDNRCLTLHFNTLTDTDIDKKADDHDFYYDWWAPNTNEERNGIYNLRSVEHEAWHHIAISFNKRAYKVYFDNQRVANIPNAKVPKWFKIRGQYATQRLYFIKNVRIAKGAVPLYDRMASEGKIVTYGITFEVGKSTIKPESTGEINRIKSLMDQDPSLKFEVQGHCDNTGSADVNNKLSQQRAEAIVARLVELGIDRNRLTAVGKGSSSPIADNSTDEGRAKNRRVVFIKK